MSFLFLLLAGVVLVVILSQRADLDERLRKLESDIAGLRRELWSLKGGKPLSKAAAKAAVAEEEDEEEDEAPAKPAAAPKLPPPARRPLRGVPVSVFELPKPEPRPEPKPTPKPEPKPEPKYALSAASVSKPAPAVAARQARAEAKSEPAFELPKIDWEQFTGVKLFAWLGGIALFIAFGFFVKYSIDNNWLPAPLRLAISAAVGLGLIAGSFRFEPKRYAVLRQVLAAGGVGVLFAVILAATLYYQYLPKPVGFGLLALTALAAFALAAAQKAPATAVLGALGAWIALFLIEAGQAGLLPLFAYLAVVLLSLHQVARRLDLAWLSAFGTLGNLLAMIGVQSMVATGAQPWEQSLAWIGQFGLFTFAIWDLPWDPREHESLGFAAILSYLGALGAGFSLLRGGALAPGLCATGALGLLEVVGMRQKAWASGALIGAVFSWLLLLSWALLEPATAASNGGLLVLLGYGVIGGLGPILLLRDPKLAEQMRHWLLAFPMGLAVLGLGIAISHPGVPALFWPVDVLLQFLGLALALVAGGVIVALVVMLSLLGTIAIWVLSPAAVIGLDGPLFCAGLLLGGLAVVAGLLWLGQNLGSVRKRMGLSFEEAAPAAALGKDELLPWLTASPVLGAFGLLAMAFSRLNGQAPHTGMATALCLLIIGLALAQRLKHAALAAVTALSATLALASWAAVPAVGLAPDALGWSLGLWAVLCLAPFVLYTLEEAWLPAWCAHALAMAGLSLMVMALGRQLFTPLQGAPLLLALTVLQLIAVARLVGQLQGQAVRNSILAFWGAGLLLLVSAFPVLILERGWLGLAFVFEGAGLVWLNGRVRHPLLPPLGLIAGIYGIVELVLRYAELRGAGAAPLGNPAFLAIAAATVLQTLAALEARRQSPEYPQSWRLAQRWTAVGMGFYLLNLAIAESFGSGPANGFDLSAHDNWLQYALYTFCWALVGGSLWAFLRERSAMAWAAFGLLMIAVLRTLSFPWVYPLWVPGLGPWLNAAWLVFLPVIAILSALRLWELRRGGGGAARALLWCLLAVIFIAFKVESSSTLQGGEPLRLFLHHNPPHALSQAFGWSLFGLILLLWPRELETEFRAAGLGLFVLACLRGASIPLRYADAWPESLPLANGVWLCLALQSGLLFWLARRQWPQGRWPLSVPATKLLGPLAVLAGFFTVNVGVAQCFRENGQPLHLDAQGSLGQRLANSLSWMAYGLGLLFGGIRERSRGLRLVGLGLMAVTAVRVFLGDLYKMGGLYRVAAFVGLAFSLLLVSYLYQRFGSQAADQKEER